MPASRESSLRLPRREAAVERFMGITRGEADDRGRSLPHRMELRESRGIGRGGQRMTEPRRARWEGDVREKSCSSSLAWLMCSAASRVRKRRNVRTEQLGSRGESGEARVSRAEHSSPSEQSQSRCAVQK